MENIMIKNTAMERDVWEKLQHWLLPAVLILFILEIAAIPFVLSYTYSGRGEAPTHVLTYTQGKLTWDNDTEIRSDGSAILDLFDYMYGDKTDPDVRSADGENVLAPGTDGFNVVRLKNSAHGNIKYTAVLYRIQSTKQLPLNTSITGSGATTTTKYRLPEGVSDNHVVTALTGTIDAGKIQDFDLSWNWKFYENDARDKADTMLGNKVDPDDVTLGLYIEVKDDNSYITPDKSEPGIPKTGDESMLGVYGAFMAISFVMLILLLVERCKNKGNGRGRNNG